MGLHHRAFGLLLMRTISAHVDYGGGKWKTVINISHSECGPAIGPSCFKWDSILGFLWRTIDFCFHGVFFFYVFVNVLSCRLPQFGVFLQASSSFFSSWLKRDIGSRVIRENAGLGKSVKTSSWCLSNDCIRTRTRHGFVGTCINSKFTELFHQNE